MKDLCIRETYVAKDGEEKSSWNKIGVLIETNDKQYVKLFHIPGVLINVFEQKPRETTQATPAANTETFQGTDQVKWDE